MALDISEGEKMINQHIRGVALIVKNSKEEILILQEYETKPHIGKYCGMFSIPMETSKPNEPDQCAVSRLIEEELPGFNLGPYIEDTTQSHVGIYRIVPHVWVNLYSITTSNSYVPDFRNSKNEEVGNYQWLSPKEALSLWLRRGAWEMIDDFMHNKRWVLCRYCHAPEKR